jgi:hypothetical protein
MENERVSQSDRGRVSVQLPPQHAARTLLLWGAIIASIVVADLTLTSQSIRLNALRVVLTLAAAGEGLGGTFGALRPRWFAEQNGRPYDPAYHGVSQDFGFYNLAFALLFILAVLNPGNARIPIATAVALYTVHGVTHMFRYFGLYYGGGTPISTRPQALELRDGLQLVAAATGMVLFLP